MESSMNIQIGIDSTDHIGFFCPICRTQMHVMGVATENVVVQAQPKKMDLCTVISLVCPNCKTEGDRKVYWTNDDMYCTQRTDTPSAHYVN